MDILCFTGNGLAHIYNPGVWRAGSCAYAEETQRWSPGKRELPPSLLAAGIGGLPVD